MFIIIHVSIVPLKQFNSVLAKYQYFFFFFLHAWITYENGICIHMHVSRVYFYSPNVSNKYIEQLSWILSKSIIYIIITNKKISRLKPILYRIELVQLFINYNYTIHKKGIKGVNLKIWLNHTYIIYINFLMRTHLETVNIDKSKMADYWSKI